MRRVAMVGGLMAIIPSGISLKLGTPVAKVPGMIRLFAVYESILASQKR